MKYKHGSRAISLLLSVVLVLCLLPMPVKAADIKPEIQIGDYIRLGTYNGEAIVWRCVAKDNNGPLMLSDKVLEDSMPYDATTGANAKTGSHRRNSWRSKHGSNHWRDSNMRSWLNSSAEAGAVDWLCGNPPDADHVLPSTAAYNQKEGFLRSFSQNEIGVIKTVTQRSIVSHPEYTAGYLDEPGTDLPYNTDISTVADGYDKAYYENIIDKVFLLDVRQLHTIYENRQTLGSYYIARNRSGAIWNYWLRTPVTNCNHDMRYVTTGGSIGRDSPYKGYYGVRPAFYLDTENYAVSSGDGKTAGSAYVMTAPNAPDTSISISGGERDTGNGNWDVDTDQYLQVELSERYTTDREYANPTIPVYVIQKPRSDTENMVILFCAEGYTKSQQADFINDVQRLWQKTLNTEPYRSMADRFNVYALCTASKDGFNGSSTFFQANKNGISVNYGVWRNHILERIIGTAFLEKIHDAHIPNTTMPEADEYRQYDYVYKHINQFVVLANSGDYFGGSHDNIKSGIHYLLAAAKNNYSPFILRHELGHGLFHLGDEYTVSTTPVGEASYRASLNISHTADPAQVKWKNMLGFRRTYSCPHADNSYVYNSSAVCLMRDSTINEFCDVCALQGTKRMSQLVKDPPTLYVAVPEVKLYTGSYRNPSDNPDAYRDANYSGYWRYQQDRENRLLSGGSKNRFSPDMKGREIELRTIIQNLSDTEAKNVTLRLWVEHSNGTKAVTATGTEVSATKDVAIPVWSEKSKFWPKGALEYTGSDFDSGLVNCSLVYTIPQDAVLRDGDTIGFEVVDSATNEVLANDDTETQKYADVTIRYELEDGTNVPNTKPTTLPVPVGTKVDWQAPKTMNGYTLIETKGADQAVSSSGLTITYIYKAKEEQPEPPKATYSVEYDWGQDAPSDKRLPTDSNIYETEAAARASKDTTFDNTSTSTAKKENLEGTWTFSGWNEGVLTGNVLRFTGAWAFRETPKVDAAKPTEIRLVSAEYEEGQPITALNGETKVGDNGVLTYQWYSSDSIDNFNGTPIDGETNAAFTPKVSVAGTYYYYVIATNTKADATGEKTAATCSNMATITVTAKPVTYTVSYDWGREVPSDVKLPSNEKTYKSVEEAKAAMDKTYTGNFISTARKDGKAGTWRFSGWTASVVNTIVKFTGSWTFTEAPKVDAAAPAAITLTSASYELGSAIAPLNGTTTVKDNGTITYQWYSSEYADRFQGTAITGETNAVFTPAINAAGKYYYYVIATNTKADATGEKIARTTSNMAVITISKSAPAVTYTAAYDWGAAFPAGETLPKDSGIYPSVDAAKAAMDTKYTNATRIKAQQNGKDGTWTFSGWKVSVAGTTVQFTGQWTFKEDTKPVAPPVNPGAGGSGGSGGGGGSLGPSSYAVSAVSGITNGSVSVTPTTASKGTTVKITVKPNDGYELNKITVTDQSGNRIVLNDQGNGKYTFAMPAANVSVDATFRKTETTINFLDVKRNDYFYEAVQWAVKKGITDGIDVNIFSPNTSCTRAQMVTFLWRAGGSPAPKSTATPFKDIDPSAYYYNAVLWAVEKGITSGTGTDTFSPNAPVTRGQTVTFLHRAAGSPAAGNSEFNDVSGDAYYAKAVAWADENNITSGTGNGKFSPDINCKRAEIVTLLYRAKEK